MSIFYVYGCSSEKDEKIKYKKLSFHQCYCIIPTVAFFIMTLQQWEKIFELTHLESWPTAGLLISKVCPNGTNARSIYNDDKKSIHAAAIKYGYEITTETPNNISFQNKNIKGERIFKIS